MPPLLPGAFTHAPPPVPSLVPLPCLQLCFDPRLQWCFHPCLCLCLCSCLCPCLRPYLCCSQVHQHGYEPPLLSVDGHVAMGTPKDAAGGVQLPHAMRHALLLELKAGEANHRQVLLCVTSGSDDDDDDDGDAKESRVVLKTCATDSLGDAYAEQLTGRFARRLGVASPLVRACRRPEALLSRLLSMQADGRIVSLPSEAVRPELWCPARRSMPFVYVMEAMRGKTLLELSAAERRRLPREVVLPAVGLIAALDALVNNWDRWPLPTLWQKSQDYLRMSDEVLASKCAPMRALGSGSAVASLEAAAAVDGLLRHCGCNLGNVLLHPRSGAVASIDTCAIGGAPADYPTRVGAFVDEVMAALRTDALSPGTRVLLALLCASMGLDAAGGSGESEEAARLLHIGMLRGFTRAAELSEAELDDLEAAALAGTEVSDGGTPLAGPSDLPETVTNHLREASLLVRRNVEVCRERREQMQQVLQNLTG